MNLEYLLLLIKMVIKQQFLKISCKSSEKISDIIEKYKKATSDKSSNLKFIFNAKKLNENFTVSESGLVDGSVIYIIN